MKHQSKDKADSMHTALCNNLQHSSTNTFSKQLDFFSTDGSVRLLILAKIDLNGNHNQSQSCSLVV